MPDSKVKVIISGVDDFSQTFSRFESAAGQLNNELRGLIELSGAAAGFEFVNKISEGVDAMGRLSQKTGVAIEDLSALAFAANMDDVSVETLAKGLEKLSKSLVGGDLSPKAQAASKAITNLGVSTRDASGKLKPLTEIMGDLADKFKNVIPANERAGYAMTIFGKSGAEMLPVLLEGRDGLQAFEDQAKSLGKVLSEDDVEQAREFQDGLKVLKAEVAGLATQFVEGLLPSLNSVLGAMTGMVGLTSEVKAAGQTLGEYIRGLAAAFAGVAYAIDLSILKGEQFMSWADKMNHRFNPAGAAISDKIFGKMPDFGDVGAGIQQLDKEFDKLWGSILNPAGAKSHPLQETISDLKDLGGAAIDTQAMIKAFFDTFDALTNKSNSLLEKEQDPLQRRVDEIDKQIEALHQFEAANAGILVPAAEKQKNDLLKERTQIIQKQIDELRKYLDDSASLNSQLGTTLGVTPAQLPNAAPGAGALAELDKLKNDTVASNEAAQRAWESTRTKAEQYAIELAKINTLHEKGAIDDQTYNRALTQLKGQYDDLTMAVNELSNGLFRASADGLANFFTDIETGTKSASAAFADFGKSIISEMNRIIAKMIAVWLVEQLIGFFTGGGGGGGGGTDALGGFSGLDSLGGGDGAFSVPFFAAGGPMDAGQVGIVGDAGPELWVPDAAGSVVPLDKMSAGGAGVTNITYDFRNADPGSEARIMAQIKQMGAIARAQAVSDVREMRLRGMG